MVDWILGNIKQHWAVAIPMLISIIALVIPQFRWYKQKVLETSLAHRQYVSQIRFDAEFQIYRDLSQVFSEAIEGVHGIIPTDAAYYPVDDVEKQDYVNHLFIQFAKASYSAQKKLFANAPFISKELFNKFDEIMELIRTQSEVYSEANLETSISSAEGKITDEDTDRTKIIDERFKQLTDEIRTYLSNLEIVEQKHR